MSASRYSSVQKSKHPVVIHKKKQKRGRRKNQEIPTTLATLLDSRNVRPRTQLLPFTPILSAALSVRVHSARIRTPWHTRERRSLPSWQLTCVCVYTRAKKWDACTGRGGGGGARENGGGARVE